MNPTTPRNGALFIAAAACLWMPLTAFVSRWETEGIVLATIAFLLPIFTVALPIGGRAGTKGASFRMLGGLFVGASVFTAGALALGLEIRAAYPGGEMVSPRRLAWLLPLFPLLAVITWLRERRRDPTPPPSEP